MTQEILSQLPYETIPHNGDFEMRALHPEDDKEVFATVYDNREYIGKFLRWVKTTTEVAHSRAFIESTIRDQLSGSGYTFGIYKDGKLIGHVSLMHLKDEREPEVGYWIVEEMEGQGITTEAARAITDFAINTLGLPRVIIRARPENEGSNRIAEKLGYLLEGQATDEHGIVQNVWAYEPDLAA